VNGVQNFRRLLAITPPIDFFQNKKSWKKDSFVSDNASSNPKEKELQSEEINVIFPTTIYHPPLCQPTDQVLFKH
jgi:hypothetical protein